MYTFSPSSLPLNEQESIRHRKYSTTISMIAQNWICLFRLTFAGEAGAIQAKLQQIVQMNQLQRFYPPQAIQALAQRISQTVDFNQLAAK